eukprot:CAMPEP_0177619866 /NCGR_PEP_ID=MMETSP0419_2-20121207/26534_1 /TAXON_ID=582737 /ORGANISM="Tetraselmis sp., Strain GSL018" /LENGTH=233 /DNA_ID=CAMNT_0019119253 /DNA_START=330 /DNA_END=1026 /DNA_ORIENTATION=+
MTRNALSSLRNQTGLRILEVHLKQWPKSASDFAVCHRNFYANNHAEKNFSVPSQFFEDSFVEKVKGTGPFTVVATAVSCFSASNVTVASCGQAEECDNAPKSVFLVSLKKRLRKTFSKGNKYAIHATVNRNEAMHDAESLFGPGYYEALVRKKLGGATWNGAVRRDQTVGCVKLIGREAVTPCRGAEWSGAPLSRRPPCAGGAEAALSADPVPESGAAAACTARRVASVAAAA